MCSLLFNIIVLAMPFGIQSKQHIDMSLPQELDWRWYKGQRYTTWTRNQNIPNYCNAGWAFAVTSSLSDRIMILNNNTFPEWVLSPQVLLKCDMNNQGCNGGTANNAFQYIQTHGISTEGCAPYQARGCGNITNNKVCNITAVHCSQVSVCKSCWEGTCKAQYPYQLFYIKEYSNIKDENEILQALQDGPVVCGMCATPQFANNFNDTQDKIIQYSQTTNCIKQNHSVSIVGYGTQSNIKYWIVRNSFGQYWGYKGYFRIERGNNTLGIEQECFWVTPNSTSRWINSSETNVKDTHRLCRTANTDTDWLITDPLPEQYINFSDLPERFQWNDMNGTNYLSLPRNQRVPHSCASCWAHSTTSALSDRLNIQRGMKADSLWPTINLSPQVLVNAFNGCSGGNTQNALKYICQHGIPHETCQQYVAENDPHGTHKELNVCEICDKGNVCKAMVNYTLYYVEQYGNVTGIENMKKEIYGRGPIECGIDSTSKFVQYTGGIFSQSTTNSSKIDHSVSIWGWSVNTETGKEYWFGRNSWGQYWGEQGFFRLQMGSNLIETDCTWGVPTQIKPKTCTPQF